MAVVARKHPPAPVQAAREAVLRAAPEASIRTRSFDPSSVLTIHSPLLLAYRARRFLCFAFVVVGHSGAGAITCLEKLGQAQMC